jgi:diadenosine tetraphosphate (Ap4A) HIT family hydrolase
MKQAGCELCDTDGGRLVLSNEWLRVVLVEDADFPGFARVVWQEHVREMSDLDEDGRARLMRAVCAVERAQRDVLQPVKVNLASLGNVTPHLHWHVIPRATDDSHFPQPIWGPRQRDPALERLAAWQRLRDRLQERIAEEVARAGRG